MRLSFKINCLENVIMNVYDALAETAGDIIADVQAAGTMPFESRHLQNEATYADTADKDNGLVRLVSDAPYAARLYYHPEYQFSKEVNAEAGGYWFQPYIDGDKSEMIVELLREKLT